MGNGEYLEIFRQYFLPVKERNEKNVRFCIFIGHNDELNSFLSRYYVEAKAYGAYLQMTIQNPTDLDVKCFNEAVGSRFEYTKEERQEAVKKWFDGLSSGQLKYIYEILEHILSEMQKSGMSENILRNSFIKFMCWMKYSFLRLLRQMPFGGTPKILYEGQAGKYQMILLKAFSILGCDVVMLDFKSSLPENLNAPLYFVPKRILLENIGIPKTHFSQIDWRASEKRKEKQVKIESQKTLIQTNTWLGSSGVWGSLFIPSELRNGKEECFCNIFCEHRGAEDVQAYQNNLFKMTTGARKQGKPFAIVAKCISKPTIDETEKYAKLRNETSLDGLLLKTAEQFHFYKEELLNTYGGGVLYKILKEFGEGSSGKIYNLGVILLCWLNRYKEELFSYGGENQLPMFIYYGCCTNKTEHIFLKLLSQLPIDIIALCPDLSLQSCFEAGEIFRIESKYSLPVTEFPDSESRMAAGTVAHQAERELDTLLYTDTGMFRDKQFKQSVALNLKTSYDEIHILWKEQAKYRPHFEVAEDRVVVPNIFAKISGVRNGNVNQYIENIKQKVNDDTIVINQVPYRKAEDENPLKPHAAKFVKNGKLQMEAIIKHPLYPYDYLAEEVQGLVFEKIQMLIDEDIIDGNCRGMEYAIVSVLLNLDKETVRLIQGFDFTQEVPKLLLIDTTESMCSMEDCIYISFLSLIGFDILIYAPTGYRTIEKYLKRDILEEHIIGDFIFDMKLPSLEMENSNEESFLQKFFRRGRN